MNAIQPVNPEGLMKSPAFSQAILTHGKGKTLYIGGQNAVNEKGEPVGKGSIEAQTEQIMQNIQRILASCGASFDHVVKFSIFIVQGQDVPAAFQTSQKYTKTASQPAAVSAVMVAGLGRPDYLIEIDAIAFIPE